MEPCGHSPVWEGQRVERTNARGRHTYVAAFKRWIVEQARRPGMSVAGLALSNQVNANQLRRWIQLHGTAAAALPAPRAALLPVTVVTRPAPEPPPRGPSAAIEIEVAGTVVRVHDGAAATTLRMVLACLRGTEP